MPEATPSLFPELQQPSPLKLEWTKEDTARVVSSREHLEQFDLVNWENHAASIAKIMGWKTYDSKVLLFGIARLRKKVGRHTIRFEKWHNKRSGGAIFKLMTTRNGHSIGYNLYTNGSLSTFGCPESACSSAEKAAIEAVFLKALLKISMIGIIPPLQIKLKERATGHEILEFMHELRSLGFSDDDIVE